MASAIASVIRLSDVRRTRRVRGQSLSVSLSKFVSGDPCSSRQVTCTSDKKGVQSVVAFLSVPENASQGTKRTDPFEQEMAARGNAIALCTQLMQFKVFYIFSPELSSVEILSIYRIRAMPPPTHRAAIKVVSNENDPLSLRAYPVARRRHTFKLVASTAAVLFLSILTLTYSRHLDVGAGTASKRQFSSAWLFGRSSVRSFDHSWLAHDNLSKSIGTNSIESLTYRPLTGWVKPSEFATGAVIVGDWRDFSRSFNGFAVAIPEAASGSLSERIDYSFADLKAENTRLYQEPSEYQIRHALQGYLDDRLESIRKLFADMNISRKQVLRTEATRFSLRLLRKTNCRRLAMKNGPAFECAIVVVAEEKNRPLSATLKAQFIHNGIDYAMSKVTDYEQSPPHQLTATGDGRISAGFAKNGSKVAYGPPLLR